jgi:8-oxo-dGTP pyrophosphatase MutT (NUDIX family)
VPTLRRFASGASLDVSGVAQRWFDAGSPTSEPRLAATVLLVRDGEIGIEVFMQRRAATMAFAPRMVVFPGGRVDPTDLVAEVDEEQVHAVAAGFGVDAGSARGIVAAAVREVEEESGVRLAVGDLRPRARWVTPAFEPRRYDTFFFAARLPDGAEALGATSETTEDFWGPAASLLAEGSAGTLRLMPPTVVCLEEVATFDSVDDFLADRPPLDAVEPYLAQTPDGWVLETRLPTRPA